jgi:hypothetical protein
VGGRHEAHGLAGRRPSGLTPRTALRDTGFLTAHVGEAVRAHDVAGDAVTGRPGHCRRNSPSDRRLGPSSLAAQTGATVAAPRTMGRPGRRDHHRVRAPRTVRAREHLPRASHDVRTGHEEPQRPTLSPIEPRIHPCRQQPVSAIQPTHRFRCSG